MEETGVHYGFGKVLSHVQRSFKYSNDCEKRTLEAGKTLSIEEQS